jgi:hypothetical protein
MLRAHSRFPAWCRTSLADWDVAVKTLLLDLLGKHLILSNRKDIQLPPPVPAARSAVRNARLVLDP